MNAPKVTLAFSLYDRHVPFFDGTVAAQNLDLQVLAVGEANVLRDGGKRHHRMLIDLEFDACEVSLSSYIVAKSRGLALTAIPVFPRRLFTQSNIWVRDDSRITEPKDLLGRKVGVITFQTTLSVQAKGDLQAEYGVAWRDIHWHVAAEEPIAFDAPADLQLTPIPKGQKLADALSNGVIDAVIAPRPPVLGASGKIHRLFSGAREEEARYFRRHGFFPAMHVIALRQSTVQKYPWVARSLVDAFRQAQAICFSYYGDPNWTVHAWTQHAIERERDALADDLWPIGLARNRNNLELFQDYLLEQGLIGAKMALDELFVDGSNAAP